MTNGHLFETPQPMPKIENSFFYHTIDLPGYGTIDGIWDLRENVNNYFGRVDFSGKRVLDVGTATGFLAFEAERMGAEVVAFDMDNNESYDCIPYYHELTVKNFGQSRKQIINFHKKDRIKMHNGFWFSYHALNSHVKVCYGSAYDIPAEIGCVDISVFGAILLHLRNPLKALESAANLTRETIIVTEPMFLDTNYDLPTMMLAPCLKRSKILDTWWQHTPALLVNFLQILGFTETKVTYHEQIYTPNHAEKTKFFTVVGRRPKCILPESSDSTVYFGLQHTIEVSATECKARPNEPIAVGLFISNTGNAKWLYRNENDFGAVKVGLHLYDSDRNEIERDYFRSTLAEDIHPGQNIDKTISFTLPIKGIYYIGVDLVSEHVCWFANFGSEEKLIRITIE